jgi:putative hydrolase of the HAD superfamily
MTDIQLLAFDADDTLWENEIYYQRGRERFNRLLARYGVDAPPIEQIDAIELANLPLYGYGAMAFVLSLIEAAIALTDGRVAGEDLRDLLELAKEMLSAEVELFEHARPVLAELHGRYPLMLITKGDLNHQLAKVARSGLQDYFAYVEVVHTKTPDVYASLFDRHGFAPENVLMVGNALRSDILPVLELGGRAVYIPHDLTWGHEHAELPGGCNGRCYELQHLGELPGLLQRLD